MKLTQHARIALLAAGAITILAAGPAAAKTIPAELRVVTSAGKTLADHIQYTGPTGFRASKKADCFGSPSSAKKYKLGNANALGVLVDAQRVSKKLRPVLITDAFYGDFGSFGVCGVGGKLAPSGLPAPYWYLAHNHVGASAGANQLALGSGDSVLYYLTKGTEPGSPSELEVSAPRKLNGVKPFGVRVFVRNSGTGKRSPAAGASVNGAVTNGAGRATITPKKAGTLKVRATRGDDVPSAVELVCVSAANGGCDAAKGELILGSPLADEIKGTTRADRIRPGGGKDKVFAGGGDDRIITRDGVRDVVNCGGGNDVVLADKKDKVKNCEKVKRS